MDSAQGTITEIKEIYVGGENFLVKINFMFESK